jgi:hypothetical protein
MLSSGLQIVILENLFAKLRPNYRMVRIFF